MIKFKDIKLAYANNVLIEDANLTLFSGQRVGLVGQNGSGKTSLFRLILNQLNAESGECIINSKLNVAHVEQEINDLDQNIVEYLLNSHPLYCETNNHLPEFYKLRPEAEKMLIGLGFEVRELSKNLNEFSGGWQMRVNLAKALFAQSDILLLDEPTNHLDLETIMWLEDWLKSYKGLALIISHDREFLDNITTHTLAIKNKQLTLYSGNYSTYERTYLEQLKHQESVAKKVTLQANKMQDFIDKFRAKSSKAKQVQSRIKALEKLETAQLIHEDKNLNIQFLEPIYNTNKLISLQKITVGYENNTVIKNINLDIFQKDRIGLLGKNGSGKSTFIKAILDKSTLLNGIIDYDKKIKIGYFAQHTIEHLNLSDTPLGFL